MTAEITEVIKITERRKLTLAKVGWRVTEFEDGSVMLIASTPGVGLEFTAHFDSAQWVEFQKLIAGSQP